MKKSHARRTVLNWALAISIGIGVLLLQASSEDDILPYNATVNRDCAPADGPAFTISIPLDDAPGSKIVISIWRAPDFSGPVAFSFAGEIGPAGTARYIQAFGDPQPLSGRVSFRRVSSDEPVEGIFNLTSESGKPFSGRFRAVWGSEIVFCG